MHKSSSLLWFSHLIDDCVEPVSFAGGTAYKVVHPELRSLIERFVQVDACHMPLHTKPRTFPGATPTNLSRRHLHTLEQGLQMWAPEMRGQRYRLVALKLCSDTSFMAVPAAATSSFSSQTEQEAALASIALPDKPISLIANKKTYRKRKKTYVTMLEEDENQNEGGDDEEEEEGGGTADESEADEDEPEAPDGLEVKINLPKECKEKSIKAVQYLIGLMDRTNEIYILPELQLPESVYPALLDGQLVKRRDSKQFDFIVFNITLSNHKRYTRWAYHDRVGEMKKFIKLFEFVDTVDACINKIVPKNVRYWHDYNLVHAEYRHGEYECTGVIATLDQAKATEFAAEKHLNDRNSYRAAALNEHVIRLLVKRPAERPLHIALLKLGYLSPVSQMCDAGSLYVEAELAIEFVFQTFSREFIEYPTNWENQVFDFRLQIDDGNNLYVALRRSMIQTPDNAEVIANTKQSIQEALTPDVVLQLWRNWKENFSLQRTQNERLCADRNRMMEIHRTNTQPQALMQMIEDKSNWTQEHLPAGEIQTLIASLKLSWETDVVHPPSISYFPTDKLDFKIEAETILKVDGLKPIVKEKRKKKVERESDESEREEEDEESAIIVKPKPKPRKKPVYSESSSSSSSSEDDSSEAEDSDDSASDDKDQEKSQDQSTTTVDVPVKPSTIVLAVALSQHSMTTRLRKRVS